MRLMARKIYNKSLVISYKMKKEIEKEIENKLNSLYEFK